MNSRKDILQHYCLSESLHPTEGINISQNTSELSVVIPAFNEEHFIGQLLISLGTSNVPIEIVVVDNGSQDNTRDVVKEVASQITYPVVILESKKKGPAYARKRGMDEVVVQYLQKKTIVDELRYIAMTDADCVVPVDWILQIQQAFKKTQAAALGGRFKYSDQLDEIIEDKYGIRDYFKRIPLVAFFLAKKNLSIVHTNGANFAIEVEAYAKIGGSQQPLDENGKPRKGSDLRFGEELRKLGEKVAFLPSVVQTSARRELFSLANKAPQSKFSTMEGWVDPRTPDQELLTSILKELTLEDLQKHHEERAAAFLFTAVVFPILLHQMSTESLANVIGPTNLYIEMLQRLAELTKDMPRGEVIQQGRTFTKTYGKNLFDLILQTFSD